MADDRKTKYELFEALINRYRGLIRRLCWRHSSGDEKLCEELIQDCYIAIWYHLASLRSGVHALQQAAWVAWQCRSTFSHRKRGEMEWLAISEELTENLSAANPEAEFRETIEDLAAGLSDREQHMLRLILEGYAQREIAVRMETTGEGINKMRQRIIQKMQQQYMRNVSI